MPVLDERGLFWWHHDSIPEGQFAPNSCVSGLLKIDDDGRVTLELDGQLHSHKGGMAVLPSFQDAAELRGKRIEGRLKASNKHVLLSELMKIGGRFSTNGLSYETYDARNCLVGNHQLPKTTEEMGYNELEIDLTGLEEWFRLGSIESNRTETTLSVSYNQDGVEHFKFGNAEFAITYDLRGPSLGKYKTDKLQLTETVSLKITLRGPVTLTEMRDELGNFEDLFVLLTDSEYCLTWPTIAVQMEKRRWTYKWYSSRLHSDALPPRIHESPTNFAQIRGRFGDIASAWKKKREQFGPGFYLYLAVRRGMKFYVEHRFVNLIWGLEALHRKKHSGMSPAPAEVKLKAKIDRIVNQVKPAADRKWLEKRLKNAHELRLEQRIADVISGVPINLDVKNIRTCAKRCAELRNDISHFGSQRHGESYQEFVQELVKISEALAVVYHMLILYEIGIDEKTLNWWVYEGPRAYREKRALVEGGLLDANALKPAPPPVAVRLS